jgi:Iap family predicted aminopeptidase
MSDRVPISHDYLQSIVEGLESFGSHPLGFRVAGTPEERAAASYIARELRGFGLDVAQEEVPVDAWRLREAYVELRDGTRFECASFGGVPETGGRGVRAQLVDVGRGGRRQLDRVDVEGKIAFVDWQRERLWPYHVGIELGLRGAVAMIVTSTSGGPYYQADEALGTFDGIWHAEAPPCVTIRKEDAVELSAHDAEQVRVVLRAPLTRDARAINVVAWLDGTEGGPPNVIGGHHDGWFTAAFDDASAVAATLAIARGLAEAGIRPKRPVVFLSHTAEEYGVAESSYDWCYGAWYQVVHQHRDWSTDVGFYLNVEGCGRPGDAFTVDSPPELARWLRRLCRDAADDGLLPHGWKLARPNTWTEVWPFLAAGIPGVNVSTFTDEFNRTEYHTQYDTSDRVDFDYLARLTRVCLRMLLDADAGAADALDFAARARDVRRSLSDVRHHRLHKALADLESAHGRRRFTAVARAFHGIDAREAAGYPHEQSASDVEQLARALEGIRRADHRGAARALARVGLNWLCSDLGHDAFRIERARRGRNAPRACWGALGDPDIGPDCWEELASLRAEPQARPVGPWIERRLRAHLRRSRAELARRLDRMAAGAEGRTFPLPHVRRSDLP